MAQAVILPKLGQTVEEATIVKWHKNEGDAVKKGDVLFEIETDKAVLEAESFYTGTLLKVLVAAGETAPVATVVGYVGKPGEEIPEAPPAPEPATQAPGPEPAAPAETRPQPAAPAVPGSTPPRPEPAKAAPAAVTPAAAPVALPPKRLFISPRAKALARKCAIDPAAIQGTGPNGRITQKDLDVYLEERGYGDLRITPAAKRVAMKGCVDILSVRGTGVSGRIMVHDVRRVIAERPRALSKMRQVIAQRLTESFSSTPHFYVTVSVDMTDLLAFRQELKEQGQKYTVTDFILEAAVLSLQEFPTVNSVCDGKTIRWYGSVDLGIAVSVENGLVVPVVRNADDLSMEELRDQARALTTKARESKLLPDEMTGSTFTVSNMGMLDVENFHAIINPGEAAILAISSTREQVVVMDGEMKVRSMMKMTLSTDHRIVDGALGAEFANAIRTKLEDLELWKSLT